MNIVHITDASALAQLAAELAHREWIALDTEFMRVDTFHPILGLIQIGDGDHEYLIDPLAIGDISSLFPIFLAELPRKVLHACSEDIEVLTKLCGSQPKGIIDTQMAMAFLGLGLQVGYQRALQECLGIDIAKDESRSDWLSRPLSTGQVSYAALDVKYLPPLYQKLQALLQEKNLSTFFISDCQLFLDELAMTLAPELTYQEVSNAWRLRPQELAVLRELLVWRDYEARRRDIPRGFLIKNGSLFALARNQPNSLQALAVIEDVTPRILRKEGEAILRVIAEARTTPAAQWPALLPTPLPRESKKLFDALRAAASAVAQSMGVPAEVLLRKKHLEALVLGIVDGGDNAVLPRAFVGWRGEALLPVLTPILAATQADIMLWRRERQRAAVV